MIFLGLDPNLDEEVVSSFHPPFVSAIAGYFAEVRVRVMEQMLTYLRSDPLNLPIDSFSILRDRATGQSRMFGFALFASIETAKTFIDQT